MNSVKLVKFFWTGFRNWTPLCLAVVLIYGSLYIIFQQYIRLSANEILAEKTREVFVYTGSIDLTKSSAVFEVVYNKNGQPATGSAVLDGQLPTLPEGVFANVRSFGERRITWMPRPGLRFATVIVPYYDGVIMAGKSLKESENRIDYLTTQVAVSLFTTLFLIFIYTLLVEYSRFK